MAYLKCIEVISDVKTKFYDSTTFLLEDKHKNSILQVIQKIAVSDGYKSGDRKITDRYC